MDIIQGQFGVSGQADMRDHDVKTCYFTGKCRPSCIDTNFKLEELKRSLCHKTKFDVVQRAGLSTHNNMSTHRIFFVFSYSTCN